MSRIRFSNAFAQVIGGMLLIGTLTGTTGCAAAPPDPELRGRATLCLQRGMRFPDNPAVRAQAMEAAGETLGEQAVNMLLEGLRDEHAGVRFAACMAIGQLRHTPAIDAVRELTRDPDESVRVAAYFALERMGDYSNRRAWVETMRNAPSPQVRRNAVMAMGQLGNPKVKPLLDLMEQKDPDDAVRLQAIEAKIMLGDREAESRFLQDAFGGLGYRQPFALLALGHMRTPDALAALQNRLVAAPYIEAKLAAARGLAVQGRLDGFDLALQSLTWNEPRTDMPDDPPENQIMRVRTMAAMALGDMGDRRALPALHRCMETADDPRVQVAVARGILMILNRGLTVGSSRPTERTQP